MRRRHRQDLHLPKRERRVTASERAAPIDASVILRQARRTAPVSAPHVAGRHLSFLEPRTTSANPLAIPLFETVVGQPSGTQQHARGVQIPRSRYGTCQRPCSARPEAHGTWRLASTTRQRRPRRPIPASRLTRTFLANRIQLLKRCRRRVRKAAATGRSEPSGRRRTDIARMRRHGADQRNATQSKSMQPRANMISMEEGMASVHRVP